MVSPSALLFVLLSDSGATFVSIFRISDTMISPLTWGQCAVPRLRSQEQTAAEISNRESNAVPAENQNANFGLFSGRILVMQISSEKGIYKWCGRSPSLLEMQNPAKQFLKLCNEFFAP